EAPRRMTLRNRGSRGGSGFRGTTQAGQAFDEGRLLAAGVVEAEGAADLLEPGAGEAAEDLGQRDLAGAGEGIDELIPHPTVAHLQAGLVEGVQQLVPLQLVQNITLRRHTPPLD